MRVRGHDQTRVGCTFQTTVHDLRHLVRRIIQGYGYSVIEAKSGHEALEVWRREKEQIHGLLTDSVMPEGISGRELARTLLAESPALKIIFTSGYDGNPEEEIPALIEGLNFLRKPYSPQRWRRSCTVLWKVKPTRVWSLPRNRPRAQLNFLLGVFWRV